MLSADKEGEQPELPYAAGGIQSGTVTGKTVGFSYSLTQRPSESTRMQLFNQEKLK